MGLIGIESSDNELILYSKWVKQNKDKKDLTQKVQSISLSKSEEWILIKTEESLGLIRTNSQVGVSLWTELQHFTGKAKGLIIYPAKTKQGFDLDLIEQTCEYEWDEDVLTLNWKTKAKKKASTSQKIKSLWERASNLNGITNHSQQEEQLLTKQENEQPS